MEALIDGIIAGSPYGVLGLAYGLIFGVLGTMDLTLAARFTIASYAGWSVSGALGWYPALDPVVLLAATSAAALSAMACWLLLEPLSRSSALGGLVASLGLTYALQAGMQATFGAAPVSFASYPVEKGAAVLGTFITPLQGLGVVYAALAFTAVAVLTRTRAFGASLGVLSENPELACAVFGLNRSLLAFTTFVVATILVAPAAVIYTAGHGIRPDTGFNHALLAFVGTIVTGPRQPLGAGLVTISLVVLRVVSVSWSLLELAGALLGGALAFALLRRRPRVWAFSATAGGCVAGKVAAAWVGPWLGAAGAWKLSSTYEEVVPLVAVTVLLLLRPDGVLATAIRRS